MLLEFLEEYIIYCIVGYDAGIIVYCVIGYDIWYNIIIVYGVDVMELIVYLGAGVNV